MGRLLVVLVLVCGGLVGCGGSGGEDFCGVVDDWVGLGEGVVGELGVVGEDVDFSVGDGGLVVLGLEREEDEIWLGYWGGYVLLLERFLAADLGGEFRGEFRGALNILLRYGLLGQEVFSRVVGLELGDIEGRAGFLSRLDDFVVVLGDELRVADGVFVGVVSDVCGVDLGVGGGLGVWGG